MDWLFDNAQLILFVLLALAGAVKQWLDSRNEAPAPPATRQGGHQPMPPPEVPAEALSPPSIPAPQAKVRRDRSSRRATAQSGRPTIKPPATPSAQGSGVVRESALPSSQTVSPASATSVKSLLRSRGSLRRAFVLREILGAPASLR